MWGPFFDFNQESHPSTALWLRGCVAAVCVAVGDTVILDSA